MPAQHHTPEIFMTIQIQTLVEKESIIHFFWKRTQKASINTFFTDNTYINAEDFF
jgi:hypothetical protein